MLSSPEGPGNGRALTDADDEDASGGSDSGGEDGQGNGIMTESEKRRDKRRRYRRRKRDRDLQEELLVRQQHVIHPTASSNSTSTPTNTSSPSLSSSVGDKAENAKVPVPKKPPLLESGGSSKDVPSGTVPLSQLRPAVSTSQTATGTPSSKAAVSVAPPLPPVQKHHDHQQQPMLPMQQQQPASGHAPRGLAILADPQLPYGHGQGQGVGHNPEREDCSSWHFAPDHYDMTRPLYVRVCGLKAAVHIDSSGVIWLNLSQLMKLVGKTKKQTLDLYGEDAFDSSVRGDVKLLDLKDGPKASAYVSELRARQLVIPFMGPTKSTNFLAELDRIHREFRVPNLAAYDTAEDSVPVGGPVHTPLYMRVGGGFGCGNGDSPGGGELVPLADTDFVGEEDLEELLGNMTGISIQQHE